MPVSLSDPKGSVTFRCDLCEHTFDAEPSKVEDAPERRSHPFRYFAECQYCQMLVSEAPWQPGLFAAQATATGPVSAEGKRISAKNLDGHDTTLTRFNAMKHGAYSRTAIFFPAKPGQYPTCDTCDVDHDYCRSQPACLKRTELMMKHMIAFVSQDPSHLTEIRAIQQSNVAAIFDDLIQAIVTDGVRLKSPKGGFDKDGGFHLAEFTDRDTGERTVIEEINAHPLLKPMLDMLAKNNMALGDLSMTPKVQTDQGIEMGRLAQEGDDREKIEDHVQRLNEKLEIFAEMQQRAKAKSEKDPIQIEFNQEES